MTQITDLRRKNLQKKQEVFMKKILLFLLAIFVMALFSAPAFADATTDGVMGSSPHDTSVKLSANVKSSYLGGALGVSYAATTFNPKGTGRAYGTASDTTYIMYEAYAATNTVAPVVGTANSSNFPSNAWSKIGE